MPRLTHNQHAAALTSHRRPPPRRWTARFAVRLCAGLALTAVALGGGAWLSLSGTGAELAAHWAAQTRAATVKTSATAGLRIEKVTVEGRQHSSRAALLRASGLRLGMPMVTISADKTRAAIEALPWIAKARVRKELPGTVHIALSERRPAALWQHQGKLRLIDADGAVLTDAALGRFAELPIVIGSVAYEIPLSAQTADRLCTPAPARAIARCHRVPAFSRALDRITDNASIAKRLYAMRWMGQRRWDLHFHNGTVIKLPAKGMVGALARLNSLHRSDGLLNRAVAMIDLRLDDRLIVRPRTDVALSVRPIREEEI